MPEPQVSRTLPRGVPDPDSSSPGPRASAPPPPVTLELRARSGADSVARAPVDDLLPRGSAAERAGRASIRGATQAHREAVARDGIGLYYGTRSSLQTGDPKARSALELSFARKHARSGISAEAAAARLTPMSCIGWAMKHVRAVYLETGRGQRWKEIARIMANEDLRGTTLARELAKDGWKVVLFTPDAQGGGDPHAARALRTGRYHGIRVDDRLIGLTEQDPDAPGTRALRSAGFFFGLVDSGRHTFVGSDGAVSEFHWRAEATDPRAMSEPWARTYLTGSGVLVFPPGAWRAKGSSAERPEVRR